jgi:hypothetical protein
MADLAPLTLSSTALRKISTPPPRQLLLSSLRKHPPSLRSLEAFARSKGMSVEGLATRTGDGAVPRSLPLGSDEDVTGDYASVDWTGGVQFTPCAPGFVYAIGDQQYNAGGYAFEAAFFGAGHTLATMTEADAIALRVPTGEANLLVELPPGEATYIISFQLAPAYGGTLSGWLGRSAPGEVLKVQIATGAGVQTPTGVLLSDGSGYALLTTIRPDSDVWYLSSAHTHYGMREANCLIILRADPDHVTSTGPGVVFGGITITRL